MLRDRQTGDRHPSTFFGNTLVLMSVLLSCYDINGISLFLAARDDSVIPF